MKKNENINTILLADDDADDRLLLLEAFEENKITCQLKFVEDGADLLDYLNKKGKYDGHNHDSPDLILLDINMPKKDGKKALEEIKTNNSLKHIPVIMFSTSKSPEDVANSYRLGANSFIVKPSSFEGLIEVTNVIKKYWIDTVSVKAIVSY
jgi:two-component system, response regulator